MPAAIVLAVGLTTAQADSGPREHPAEAALTLFVQPIVARRVVRNDDGGYDIWLHGDADFEKVRKRIRDAASVHLELPGAWRIAKATWLDADRSWWLDLDGNGELRVRVPRDAAGTLMELKDAGLRTDAPPWAPPFAPLPLNLVHGPIR